MNANLMEPFWLLLISATLLALFSVDFEVRLRTRLVLLCIPTLILVWGGVRSMSSLHDATPLGYVLVVVMDALFYLVALFAEYKLFCKAHELIVHKMEGCR